MDLVFTVGAYDLLAMAFRSFGVVPDDDLPATYGGRRPSAVSPGGSLLGAGVRSVDRPIATFTTGHGAWGATVGAGLDPHAGLRGDGTGVTLARPGKSHAVGRIRTCRAKFTFR